MLQSKSLSRRIFYASVTLMPVLLGFSAFMLDRAFRDSLHNAERESLLAHSYSMMGAAEPDNGQLRLPSNLTDPRFNTPSSGLYAQVFDIDKNAVWQSISLNISPFAEKIPYDPVSAGSFDFNIVKIDKEKFFVSRFNTVWEFNTQDKEFQFVIVHSQKSLQSEVINYRKTLALWLGGLALLLIVLQTMIIHWGLFPLKRLASDIKQLESGNTQSLDKDYPDEILPVTQNINLLLDSEKKQRRRYKNTLADLAHSLKTPLSVVRSVLEKQFERNQEHTEWRKTIDGQIERMADIINHQLGRASFSKPSFRSSVELIPLFYRLSQALKKVYHEKDIDFVLDAHKEINYPAQEDDLMEVFGNLIENAFKYGEKQVKLSATKDDVNIIFTIEDDGPGVPEHLHRAILKRGTRADTSTPGQGIGLAVAADIVSAYDGGISVKKSTMGGACFTLTLPV